MVRSIESLEKRNGFNVLSNGIVQTAVIGIVNGVHNWTTNNGKDYTCLGYQSLEVEDDFNNGLFNQ